ncbi:MAG TPA: kelch repeat-containing protein [Gemmatimonadales bacterium]|nr:kelch repeat-containing protein [Gemmatimonadales bacterium]
MNNRMWSSSALLSGVAVLLVACDPASTNPTDSSPAPTAEQSVASAAGTWTTKAPMPTSRWHPAAGVIKQDGRERLYAIGGFDPFFGVTSSVEAYDFATNSWSTKAPLPVPVMLANGAGTINGKLYHSGGIVEDPSTGMGGPVNHLYEYNPTRNTWTRKADMPKRVAQGVTGVINGKLYVLAGSCGDCAHGASARLFRYDPVTNTWTGNLPPAPSAHVGGAGGVINGKFYVAGGRNWSGRVSNRLDVYDPVSNTWSTLAPMPTARSGAAAAVLQGKLFVIGANNVEPGERQGMNEAYNPATNTWSIKAPLPGAGRGDLAAAKIIHDGQAHILAVGGTDVEGSGEGNANQAYTP